jgi:hypothetical protein
MLCTDAPSVHTLLKTPRPNRLYWFLRNRRIDQRLSLTKALIHPVLKTLPWHVSVLIQTERQIDRRCPHSDRRIIQCNCLRCSSLAIHPAHLQNGPSVHPTVPTSFCLLRSVPITPMLCTDGTVGSSDSVFFLPFLRVFNLDLCFNLTSLAYLTCHYL